MISKNQFKIYTSLKQVKYRNLHNLFAVEGLKGLEELLASKFETISVITTASRLNTCHGIVEFAGMQPEIVSEKEMADLSSLSTPPGVIAIAKMPQYQIDTVDFKNKITLFLDGISDPGNMGTIIRTADWFGVVNVICSIDSVDVFNQKVVQATMGSLFRVKVFSEELEPILSSAKSEGIEVFGAVMDGKNIYETEKKFHEGILVIGSESHGIRKQILPFVSTKITIPNYVTGSKRAESLNASVAASIILAEMNRKKHAGK